MKGDFTRFTFDPRAHNRGVLTQQGRVTLDADWNEHVAIVDHLDRTRATDVIGPSGAPRDNAAGLVTPLTRSSTGTGTGTVLDYGVTAGRIYVNGLLLELGAPPAAVAGVLVSSGPPATTTVTLSAGEGRDLLPAAAQGSAAAEGFWVELSSASPVASTRPEGPFYWATEAVETANGQVSVTLEGDAGALRPGPATGAVLLRRALTYRGQPDLPGPEPIALPNPSDPLGPSLPVSDVVYLDVWTRHVTAVEDPSLREVALGGPDTATRIRTVAQIRVQRVNAGSLSCADDLPGWPPEASGGRLTVAYTEPEEPPRPCSFTVDGGYRGLENRLYRVEIHRGGPLGGAGVTHPATFVWSRDNGAVVFPIDSFEPGAGPPPASTTTVVRLARLGKDQALTVRKDDWVEVLDDATELAGSPGALRQVADVDEAARTVTLATPVVAVPAGQHPRLRRWDVPASATGKAAPTVDGDGNGLGVPVDAGPISLEEGISVSFSGGAFRTGDHWTFAARAATASVTELTQAPPAGITHRYRKLALVEWRITGDNEPPAAAVTDCRDLFPPLTDIHAADVRVEDCASRPLGVADLQQVFDAQCAQRALRYVSGDGQESRPGRPLPGKIIVGVEDGFGRPVPGVLVTFGLTGGGSLVRDGETIPNDNNEHLTDGDGRISLTWTLGADAGTQTVEAYLPATASTAAPPTARLPVRFRALAVRNFLRLRASGGDGQTGRRNGELSCRLTVAVEDADGQPVKTRIRFTADISGDRVREYDGDPGPNANTNPLASSVVVTSGHTGAAGLAEAEWVFGDSNAACHQVTATLEDSRFPAALPVHFRASLAADGPVPPAGPKIRDKNWAVGEKRPLDLFFGKEPLRVTFTEPMDESTLNPGSFVFTIEHPFQAVEFGTSYQGLRSTILVGDLEAAGDDTWTFSPRLVPDGLGADAVQRLIQGWTELQGRLGASREGVRCRVTLKGNLIRGAGGAVLTGDDLDTWFWVVP
ncbi:MULTISPECIES: DUF6519 domain-containing protein [unclassified Frankia]|uniref:DUF6519 domain-containing protein n=1 Tax=unclassified Frankia TaxID=2632575 RepID=UPI0020255E37